MIWESHPSRGARLAAHGHIHRVTVIVGVGRDLSRMKAIGGTLKQLRAERSHVKADRRVLDLAGCLPPDPVFKSIAGVADRIDFAESRGERKPRSIRMRVHLHGHTNLAQVAHAGDAIGILPGSAN